MNCARRDEDDFGRQHAVAKNRPRRIIYNDDGGALWPGDQQAIESPEDFLAARFRPTVGTQVDTYFWCIGIGEEPPWGGQLVEAIGDPNQVVIEAARQAGMEIFASLRMNDIHDAWSSELTYPLKAERPDLLIGKQFWPEAYPHLLSGEEAQRLGGYPKGCLLYYFWSAFDYAKQEVRDHRYDYIMKMARRYDFDGFEMDFFRHSLFFKPGEERENLDTMTGFVRRVR